MEQGINAFRAAMPGMIDELTATLIDERVQPYASAAWRTPAVGRWGCFFATYSPSTVRNAYVRLSALLDVAVSYRLVTHNVAKGVVLPKIGSGPQHYARATLAAMREAVELLAAHYEKGK